MLLATRIFACALATLLVNTNNHAVVGAKALELRRATPTEADLVAMTDTQFN